MLTVHQIAEYPFDWMLRECHITALKDGDTYVGDIALWGTEIPFRRQVIRLWGWDTPERKDKLEWKAATKFAADMIFKQWVTLAIPMKKREPRRDSFGRILSAVYTLDGVDLGMTLNMASHAKLWKNASLADLPPQELSKLLTRVDIG